MFGMRYLAFNFRKILLDYSEILVMLCLPMLKTKLFWLEMGNILEALASEAN